MIKPRPALFKWRHFEPEIIVCAVRWYLRFSLSYRDVEELLIERGLPADHSTIWRWVQRYAPELNKRCRRELKPTNGSWRVDETYICQGGSWRYLYRAVDSTGATIDFWFSAERDAAAAKQFFQKALQAPGHPRPRVITVDGNPSYPKVIAELKQEGKLGRRCRCRTCPYLNNVMEQVGPVMTQTTRNFLPTSIPAQRSMTASIISSPCGRAANERKTKLFHGLKAPVRGSSSLAGSD
jgi:transposase-like protein